MTTDGSGSVCLAVISSISTAELQRLAYVAGSTANCNNKIAVAFRSVKIPMSHYFRLALFCSIKVSVVITALLLLLCTGLQLHFMCVYMHL